MNELHIEKAEFDGKALVLSVPSNEAYKLVYEFKPGAYTLQKAKKKRSLDANAYLWALCDKIADKVRLTKEDVYRRAIREVGVFTPLPIREDALKDFEAIWSAHGLGWVLDVIDDSKLSGYKLCYAYQGSSTYDTAQMSRLIDNLVQEADTLGIETLSEREKSLLLEDWDAKHS